MRTGKIAITAVAAATLVLTTPSTAWGAPKAQAPSTKVLTSAVIAPYNLAVDRNRILVADGNKLSRVKGDGTLRTIATGSEKGDVAGVAISKNRRSIAYTTTDHPTAPFENVDGALHIRHAGGGTLSVDLEAYEAKKNPDEGVSYGVKTTADCAKQIEEATDGQPASYTGLVDSHPYSVTAYGKRSWIVADAGGNDLLKVNRHGRVSLIAVLPVQPLKLTADVIEASGLPKCATDLTANFEAVPTDVEVGRNGYLYVSTLAGGPESPVLGGRSSVYRVNPRNGHVKLVATGFLGATNLALHRSKIYVSEFYAGQISVIKNGKPKPYLTLPGVVSIESGRGHLYAGTFASEDGKSPGTVVKIVKGKAKKIS